MSDIVDILNQRLTNAYIEAKRLRKQNERLKAALTKAEQAIEEAGRVVRAALEGEE